jgi:hypothetical protein
MYKLHKRVKISSYLLVVFYFSTIFFITQKISKYLLNNIFKKMVCGNFKARRANITGKKNRHWLAREKLMIIMYHENSHSKRSTADKYGIEPKQLRE